MDARSLIGKLYDMDSFDVTCVTRVTHETYRFTLRLQAINAKNPYREVLCYDRGIWTHEVDEIFPDNTILAVFTEEELNILELDLFDMPDGAWSKLIRQIGR